MKTEMPFDWTMTGVRSPNHSVRDYDLSRDSMLVGLLDHPLYPPHIEDSMHTHNCMEIIRRNLREIILFST